MMNKSSLEAVTQSDFSKCFVKPLYDSFGFSRIVPTVSYLLTGEKKEAGLPTSCYQDKRYEKVVFLFLDAFGWRFFERFSSHPFLQRFEKEGVVSKITSQFPSTTAAHVTSVHTGLEVGQTGVYEWFQYEPQVDKMIVPLQFTYAGEGVHQALIHADHKKIFPFQTFYRHLHEKAISSYVFQHAGISDTPYSQVFTAGGHALSYLNFKQGLQSLSELLKEKTAEKLYAFFYFADIDSVGHRKGITSAAFDKEILHCLDLLESELSQVLQVPGTALMISADHGMVAVRPRATIYLNLEMPFVLKWIKVNQKGEPLLPAGSCRDFFLHIKEEYLNEAQMAIQTHVQGRAEVWKVQELIQMGFFGRVSTRFLQRVGNLVILPYENEGVWWYEKHKFSQNFYAAHGGLTRGEMETIFLFLGR